MPTTAWPSFRSKASGLPADRRSVSGVRLAGGPNHRSVGDLLSSLQTKRHQSVAWLVLERAAAGRYQDILVTVAAFKGHRRGVTASGQSVLPQYLATVDVDRSEHLVLSGADKDDAAACRERAAKIRGAQFDWQTKRCVEWPTIARITQ